jgi:hypothetical protein
MATRSSFDITPTLDAYGTLWLAVLRQAIDDATTTVRGTTSEAEAVIEKRKAKKWLASEADRVGSATWICDVLDIPVDYVRKEFRRRKRRRRIKA